MEAALLQAIPAQHLSVETVPDPAVDAPDELLLQVLSCGICGTDLHILEGQSYRPELPFVLGHEPVGVVVEAASRAREAWLGRRVTMTLFTGCGACGECQRGDERICRNLRSISGVLGAWGGYAQYMKIHAAQAVEVPSSLSDGEVACLVDSGATAANAVRIALDHDPKSVAIVGAGPIGVIAAEILRSVGIPVLVVQSSAPRRSAMKALGYFAVPSLSDLPSTPDVVLDCSGSPSVAGESVEILGPRGAYVAAGYAVVPSFQFAIVARKELQLRGVRSGSRADLVQVLDLAASRRIRLPHLIEWPLECINDALDALRAKQVIGKAVILPGGHAT